MIVFKSEAASLIQPKQNQILYVSSSFCSQGGGIISQAAKCSTLPSPSCVIWLEIKSKSQLEKRVVQNTSLPSRKKHMLGKGANATDAVCPSGEPSEQHLYKGMGVRDAGDVLVHEYASSSASRIF